MKETSDAAPTGRHYLRYGIVGIPLAFGALPLYMHIPKFYADNSALSLSTIGVILWAARLLDGVTDPLFGHLADARNRKTLVVFGLIIFVLGFIAVCHPPTDQQSGVAIWLLLTLLVTGISLSAASIAYQAWGANLGHDSHQRSILIASREAMTLVAVIVAAALPVWISDDIGDGVSILSYVLLGVGLLSLIAAHNLPAGTQQQKTVSHQHSTTTYLKNYWKELSRQYQTLWQQLTSRWLLIIFCLNGIASAIPATLFFFFVEDVLAAQQQSGIFLVVYFLAAAIALPCWVMLGERWGRTVAWQLAMLLAIGSFAMAGWLGAGDILAFYLVCIFSGLALGADLCLPTSMAADHGEQQQQSGMLFGWWNLLNKLNLALAAGLALPILALAGYESGAAQNNTTALKVAYVGLPIALKCIALACLTAQAKRFTHINPVANGGTS